MKHSGSFQKDVPGLYNASPETVQTGQLAPNLELLLSLYGLKCHR
jgi:hypothetical protein